MIKKEGECEECGYSMLTRIVKGKKPWKFCANPKCPSKSKGIKA